MVRSQVTAAAMQVVERTGTFYTTDLAWPAAARESQTSPVLIPIRRASKVVTVAEMVSRCTPSVAKASTVLGTVPRKYIPVAGSVSRATLGAAAVPSGRRRGPPASVRALALWVSVTSPFAQLTTPPEGRKRLVPSNRNPAFVVVPVAVTNSTPFMTLLLAPEIATHALPVHVCHSPRVELKQTDSPVVGLLICEHVARMNGPPHSPRTAGGRNSSVSSPTTSSAASPQRLIFASSPSPGPARLRARTSGCGAAAR